MEDWERLLKSVRAGAERTAQIVAGLKTFSRPQVGKIEETDLIAGLETTLNLLQPLLRDRVTVHASYAPVPRVRCRGGQVQQVFMNLLTNAAQAAGPGGEIYVSAVPDGDGVRVSVRDTGPGVPAELATKIFDPFFTTKDVGEGTGLGLAISAAHRALARRRHRAACRPEPAQGAEFVVWLPLSRRRAAARSRRRASSCTRARRQSLAAVSLSASPERMLAQNWRASDRRSRRRRACRCVRRSPARAAKVHLPGRRTTRRPRVSVSSPTRAGAAARRGRRAAGGGARRRA